MVNCTFFQFPCVRLVFFWKFSQFFFWSYKSYTLKMQLLYSPVLSLLSFLIVICTCAVTGSPYAECAEPARKALCSRGFCKKETELSERDATYLHIRLSVTNTIYIYFWRENEFFYKKGTPRDCVGWWNVIPRDSKRCDGFKRSFDSCHVIGINVIRRQNIYKFWLFWIWLSQCDFNIFVTKSQ